MNPDSELLSGTLKWSYPLVILFGIYLILNGHLTPGGGFQGGAVLSAVLVFKYLINPVNDIRIDWLNQAKVFLYILILLLPSVFLFTLLGRSVTSFHEFYLVVMNLLIGTKVCFGLGVVFLRFVFYERM